MKLYTKRRTYKDYQEIIKGGWYKSVKKTIDVTGMVARGETACTCSCSSPAARRRVGA